ncbi:alpha-2-macroglobulin family protein [Tenacibaculum agarivorans]|uniref:alpha-2-macroglobulin family protein n=1 Tax=Tenacibaculum agarivorans TaxID=1908389 RepID=UPI00094B8DAE|nr:carboxypeptidase-like regulatory domain-containing protein [Tenacibaculum agarivorans]
MKNKSIVVLMLTLFSALLHAQNNYETLWNKVHTYELDNLPKSALKIVDDIYKKAEQNKNQPQLIKTLLYKSKFSLTLEEDAQLKILDQFKKHIKKSVFPTKQVLENILAKLYWQYFNQNRWRFYNRTQTAKKVDENDFRTWDLQTLFAEIHNHYQNSLTEKKKLQNIDIYEYISILKLAKDSKKYRPSLYDFLAHNALEFYKTNETQITKPSYQFKLSNQDLICEATKFVTLNLQSKDSLSLQFNALKIYQSLIDFHLNTKNTTALVDVDLQRLAFVKEHATFSGSEKIYLETLQSSENSTKPNEASALYAFEIAKLYSKQANTYSKNKHTHFQFKHKEAIQICQKIVQQFPDSFAAQKSKLLIAQIEKKNVRITTEKHNPIDQYSRLLINYKNIDKLYFSMYRVQLNELKKINERYDQGDKIKLINALTKVTSWEHTLPNESDYQTHSNEVIVPKQSQGMFLIVASTTKELKKGDIFGYDDIQFTNLTFINRKLNGSSVYQVVDRNTGKPLREARVLLKNEKTRYGRHINKTFTTDANGEFEFSPSTYYSNVNATISYKQDKAIFYNIYIQRSYEDNFKERTVTETFLFTDRSIYRPGQKLYFKGISLQRFKKKSDIIANKKIEIILKDVNGQNIKTLALQTNDYGAVSGEFIIPATGLTGDFQLEAIINGERSYHYFSVEEYKRPKFETEFKPVTQSYKLFDSIKVTGFAKSYAGTNITDAKVVYRVHRKVQYPRWFYWYRPYIATSEAQEISNGELTTNDKGEFDITFKAFPDESVSKDKLPVFSYEITADVTDINGETRSATTIVKVGYHSLLASITVDGEIDKNNKNQSISIETKNLNDEFVPASGQIHIYKLQAPKHTLRRRPWPSPDFQTIPEREFKEKFPYDAYTNEDNHINWKKGKLVFSTNFNTEKSKEIALKSMKKWTSGYYVIELDSKDKFNQKVTDKAYFTLQGKNDKLPSDNALLSVKTNKKEYNVDDTAEVTFSTNSQDITLMVFVEKAHQLFKSYYIHLDKNSKTIKIPVSKEDEGGFAIQYHFVNHNAFTSKTFVVDVPYPKTDLEITTKTFRDKLQPGAKETWSFSIKGPKKDQVTAELLVGMYDASLDQFKAHEWSFSPIQKPQYFASISSIAFSFGTSNFSMLNPNRGYFGGYPKHQYDQFNWFGFDINNNQWINKEYLNNLAIQRTTFDGTISGVIKDESSTIPFVNIFIKGTSFGAVSDENGRFTIKVNKGDILVFSFVGYKSVERKINDFSYLSITMEEDSDRLDEIAVTGRGIRRNKKNIMIRGSAPAPAAESKMLMKESISVETTESDEAEFSTDSTSEINSDKQTKKTTDLKSITARKNLQETAFFYPHLTTDAKGNVSFNFTMPEALTKWKLQLLAHTKELYSATQTLETVTQKELMVVPNAPRFLREKDQITFSAKISNLTKKQLEGVSQLILTDALTGKTIDVDLQNTQPQQNFNVDAESNTNVSWNLKIPETIQAVQYKIVAQAGKFTDGEQNVLPVLSNRMLVTETLPMWVRSNQTKTFTLNKLKNNSSTTLKHQKLSLEVTSNPAWYAVQALPYLMEYPHECAEQVFSRYYANTLASFIANSNPKIQQVFNQWKSSKALLSNLEKNQELKSLIIQETPWLRDAQSETEQKKRIALLFDLNKMQNEQQNAIHKLKNIQLDNGGFPWFKGGNYPSIYITNHIATGFGHLKKLGVTKMDKQSERIVRDAVQFLDNEIVHRHEKLLKKANQIKKHHGEQKYLKFLADKHISYFDLQYLYMRSFYNSNTITKQTQKAIGYYTKQAVSYWNDFNLYGKGQNALIQFRANNSAVANKIIESLEENSITSEELGMYWKKNTSGWYWHQAPVETQALLIEAFSEITNDIKIVDNLKIWLLKNKQVSQWKTTKATSDAVYALLLQGTDWLSSSEFVTVQIGNQTIDPTTLEDTKLEAGTGYFKTSWNTTQISSDKATVSLTKKDKGIAWGGLYWQYFEDLDKITSAKTPLQLSKKLFKKVNSDTGKQLKAVTNENLNIGDLVTIRIELKVDRDMEFIHMKDMRASTFEPVDVLSKYKWQDGLGYYQSTKDAATHFFFDRLPKGVYVFEYDVRVNNKGNFSNGISTIQSMYAPEFSSHSEGIRVNIK